MSSKIKNTSLFEFLMQYNSLYILKVENKTLCVLKTDSEVVNRTQGQQRRHPDVRHAIRYPRYIVWNVLVMSCCVTMDLRLEKSCRTNKMPRRNAGTGMKKFR